MNAIMKSLTMVSVISLPMSFIAGVYRMNFEHFVSEENQKKDGSASSRWLRRHLVANFLQDALLQP